MIGRKDDKVRIGDREKTQMGTVYPMGQGWFSWKTYIRRGVNGRQDD